MKGSRFKHEKVMDADVKRLLGEECFFSDGKSITHFTVISSVVMHFTIICYVIV